MKEGYYIYGLRRRALIKEENDEGKLKGNRDEEKEMFSQRLYYSINPLISFNIHVM